MRTSEVSHSFQPKSNMLLAHTKIHTRQKKLYGKIPALGESAFIFVTLKKYEDLTWKKKDTYFSLGIDEKW